MLLNLNAHILILNFLLVIRKGIKDLQVGIGRNVPGVKRGRGMVIGKDRVVGIGKKGKGRAAGIGIGRIKVRATGRRRRASTRRGWIKNLKKFWSSSLTSTWFLRLKTGFGSTCRRRI